MTKGGLRLANYIQSISAISIQRDIFQALKTFTLIFFPGIFFTPRGFSHMAKNINGADMPTLTVFRMELQRITDMNLKVDPIITKYMEDRIDEIEEGSD
jgi:hypothetical protein